MTISSETFKVTYSGDGSTTSFSTSFTFSANDEISVTLVTNSTGAETAWTLGTQFTLTGAGTGSAGTLTVDTSPSDYTPASGTTLVIQLAPALTQTTALPRGGTVSPKDTLEPMHDKRVRQVLSLKETLDRAVKVPISETSGGTLPLAALRADKALIFDSSGDLTTSTDDYNDQAATAASSATAAASSATAAASSATASASSATTSSNYATKVNGAVTGTDFSSKAWSVGGTNVTTTASRGAAKEWATSTGAAVDTSEYSAKEYAQGTTAASAKTYATKVDGAVTGTDFSAKAWSIGGTNVTTTASRGAAKEWATSTGAAVDTSEYSAKEYAIGTTATSSKTYATKVDGAVTGTDFSSKAWAVGGTNVTDTASRGAAKEWAVEVEDNTVDGTSYSSLHHAAKSAASAAAAASSATAAASGQLYSTVVNQTGTTLAPSSSNDGTYYLCDTSSNTITVTLPAIGTSEGMKFAFQKTHASNNLVFARSGSDTLNGSASNITITDVDASIIFVADDNTPDNYVGVHLSQVVAGTGITKTGSVISLTSGGIALSHVAIAAKTECIAIAVSDETTALEAGAAKATFHMPYAFTLTGVKAGVTTAPVGSVLTVDINEAGATILTTKLTIDAAEKTSASAATAAVIGGAGPALAADALMTVDIDTVGSGTAGAGLKIYLIGYQT